MPDTPTSRHSPTDRPRHTTPCLLAITGWLILTACGPTAPAGPPVATADGEMLSGEFLADGSRIAVFKGIPYAAPPIGDRRWRPPVPITPRDGVQTATGFGPACIQLAGNVAFARDIAEVFGTDPALVPDLEPTSENCLYLNIWTTSLGGDEPRPVMVWIHGGSNNAGSGAEPSYDGASLARRGAVVVTINYRLNVFGFLAHPALTAESARGSSGNYALLDQIAALEWVRRNIAAFGGDPGRVTIFGESAGATDVAYLLSSPPARGLFHRAIMQSGGFAVSDFRTLADEEAVGEGLAAALGVAEADDVPAAMRAVGADELHKSAIAAYPIGLNAPNVDGWILEDAPGRVFEAGEHTSVPLMIGFNSEEWTTLARYWPDVTLDGFRQALRSASGALAERAMELYPAANDAEAATAANSWQTDSWFACPSRFIADRMGRDSSNTFFFVFTRSLQAPGGDQLGAYHGAEVPYAFDNLGLEPWVPRNAHDRQLAHIMADYWVRFATTGDPNGDGLPSWPVYNSRSRGHLELGDTIAARTGIRPDRCALYDELQALRITGGNQP